MSSGGPGLPPGPGGNPAGAAGAPSSVTPLCCGVFALWRDNDVSVVKRKKKRENESQISFSVPLVMPLCCGVFALGHRKQS